MLMNLVAQRHVGARTGARLSRFPADRAEKRLLPVIREVVLLAFTAACDCPRFDLRGLIPHLDRIAEQDGRLILGRAGRIDFGARFAIGHQAIEADTSGERRLTVALSLLAIGSTEPPYPAFPSPSAAGQIGRAACRGRVDQYV